MSPLILYIIQMRDLALEQVHLKISAFQIITKSICVCVYVCVCMCVCPHIYNTA